MTQSEYDRELQRVQDELKSLRAAKAAAAKAAKAAERESLTDGPFSHFEGRSRKSDGAPCHILTAKAENGATVTVRLYVPEGERMDVILTAAAKQVEGYGYKTSAKGKGRKAS